MRFVGPLEATKRRHGVPSSGQMWRILLLKALVSLSVHKWRVVIPSLHIVASKLAMMSATPVRNTDAEREGERLHVGHRRHI